ncbi:MAG: hypothetical protein Q9219_004357 [cf. Caloplaca sp. 3 TL-2023]
MSEEDPSASSERAIGAVPDSGGSGRVKFRDRLKQVRAASRAEGSVRPPNLSKFKDRSPVTAIFVHPEPTQTARSSERRLSQAPVYSPTAHVLKDNLPLPSRPVTDQEPSGLNGSLQGLPMMPPQSSLLPQPPMYTTPENQTRLGFRPMAMPMDLSMAAHAHPNSQYVQIPPNYGTYVPQVPIVPKTPSLAPFGLGMNEHTIGLAMNSRVRDQYTSVVNHFQRPLDDFLNSEVPQEASIQEVKKLLSRVDHITTHPDLDVQEARDEFSQTSPEDEATWAEQCSFKFKFLSLFLAHMRNDAVHISIVARPGRTLDLIEAYLKGRGVPYFRPDGKRSSLSGGEQAAGPRLQVSIVPSGPEGGNMLMQPVALVIAFDGTFNAQDLQVSRMRTQPNVEWLMPVVHLLVYKSAEHVARCTDTRMDEMSRLRKIASCMTQFRHDVGMLPPEDTHISAAADEVAIFLRLNGHEIKWSLPKIREIPLDFLESSQDSSTPDGSQLSEQEAPLAKSALKRAGVRELTSSQLPLAPDINLKQVAHSNALKTAKRRRTTPAEGSSHASNSKQQLSVEPDPAITEAESLSAEDLLRAQNVRFTYHVDHLESCLKSTQEELMAATQEKQSLSLQLCRRTSQESHISDLEASMSDLQTRYESKDRSYRHLRLERSGLVDALEKANKKVTTQATEVATLKENKKSIQADLERARQDLLNSNSPDLIRIATAEAEARASAAESASLNAKIASLTSELEFTRQVYQSASVSAADLSAQVTDLTSRLEIAERKAKGEAARLAEVNRDNAVKEAKKQAQQLRVALEEREKAFRRKEDEIETLRGRRGRGGVVTRGGSVQPGSGGIGQGKSPRGSRGGSPMPGVGVAIGGEGMRRGGSGLRGQVVG